MADQWKDDLLRDMCNLPKCGAPGRILLCGSDVRPIVHGCDPCDVVMAAGQVGQGRVVIFSQNGYLTNFATTPSDLSSDLPRMQANVKDWVTHGAYKDDKDIVTIKSPGHVDNLDDPACKIALVSNGGQDINGDDVCGKVMEFLEKGGGLVYALCPWGWLSLRKQCTSTDFPLYKVLQHLGVYFTTDHISGQSGGFAIPCPEGTSYVPALFKLCDADPTNAVHLRRVLGKLPGSVVTDMFMDDINSLYQKYSTNVVVPSDAQPLKDAEKKAQLTLVDLMALFSSSKKSPGVENFPGDFAVDPELCCGEVSLSSNTSDVFATGFYLPAGKEVTITYIGGTGDPEKWKVWVGAHSDSLVKKESWERLPAIVIKRNLSAPTTKVFSPYGGPIYLQSPSEASTLQVSLDNVVNSPLFDLTNPDSAADWSSVRNAPGLWADLVGQHIRFTMPSSSIRDLEDPAGAVEFWDSVVEAQHTLRTTISTDKRKEWVVCDVQPSAGYMHAGFPIVTHLDVTDPAKSSFLLNTEYNRETGNWGLFHEIGHNMQRKVWTFSGTGEVTTNIFTLYCMDTIVGQPVWIHPWLKNQVSNMGKYLNEGAVFDKWKKDAGVALGVYAQLAHYFGWDVYTAVFEEYERMASEDEPKTDPQKMDCWIRTFSEKSQYNLAPLFRFWGFEISSTLGDELKHLPAFLIKDEVTSLAQPWLLEVGQQFDLTEVDIEGITAQFDKK